MTFRAVAVATGIVRDMFAVTEFTTQQMATQSLSAAVLEPISLSVAQGKHPLNALHARFYR
jgi:hypothetical protein